MIIQNKDLSNELKKFLKNNVPKNYKKLIMLTKFNGKKIKANEILPFDPNGYYINGIYLMRTDNHNLMVFRTVEYTEEKINSILEFDDNGYVFKSCVNLFALGKCEDEDGKYHLQMIREYNDKKIVWDIVE